MTKTIIGLDQKYYG